MKNYFNKSIFLLSFIVNRTMHALPDLDELLLEDIHVSQYQLIKQAGRAVYLDKEENIFYKIWPQNYSLARYFIPALQAGFYDNLTPLIALIYDKKGYCRGYVTERLLPSLLKDKVLKGQKPKVFNNAENQTDPAYKKLYQLLIDRAFETGYAYIDLTPGNVVFDGQQYLLIDLESVRPLKNIPSKFFNDKYSPADYRRDIRKIVQLAKTK